MHAEQNVTLLTLIQNLFSEAGEKGFLEAGIIMSVSDIVRDKG